MDLVLIPQPYKSQSSKIGLIEGHKNMFENMFEKSSKIETGKKNYFWTNLRPIPVELIFKDILRP